MWSVAGKATAEGIAWQHQHRGGPMFHFGVTRGHGPCRYTDETKTSVLL